LSQYPQYPGGLSVRQIMVSWGRMLFELYTNHTLTVEIQPVWIALSRSDVTGRYCVLYIYTCIQTLDWLLSWTISGHWVCRRRSLIHSEYRTECILL